MLKNYKNFAPEQKREFNKELAALNHKMCRRIMLIIANIEALLIIVALIGQPISDIGRPFVYITDYLYLWCYSMLFIFCTLVATIVYFVYKNPERHTKGIRAITVSFSFAICIWSVCISLLDCYYNGYYSPIVMLIVFMALAGAVHMYPWESLGLFAGTFLLYLVSGYVLASKTHVEYPPSSMLLNIGIFLGIAMVISFIKFENRIKDFMLSNRQKTQNIKLSEANAKLLNLNKQLERISITDRLTGLRNRWAFTSRLKEIFDQCKANNLLMTVAIFDLDDFKLVNDRHGHTVGDECLKDTSEILKKHIPACDLFRYGGEEFVVVFRELSEENVYRIIERIRLEIESRPLTSCNLSITISGGQFSCIPAGNISEDRFVVNADRALYHAKQIGKNRIEVYSDTLGVAFCGQ